MALCDTDERGDFWGSTALLIHTLSELIQIWEPIQGTYTVPQMNNEELRELAEKIKTLIDFKLYVRPLEDSDPGSQDSTPLLPLDQLKHSVEEMGHDLNNVKRAIEWLFLHIEILRRVLYLLTNLPQDFFRSDEEKGDAFVRGLVNTLIERHNNHKQLLYAEGQRGAKAREGASEGGRSTRQRGQQKHEIWQDMAREIWEKQSSLSIRAVADIVARQCQGKPEIEGKADTIRQRIRNLCSSTRKPPKNRVKPRHLTHYPMV